MRTSFTLRRAPLEEIEAEHTADTEALLRDLRRRVGWQTAIAYGLPLPDAVLAPEPAAPPEPAHPPLLTLVPAPAPVPGPEPVSPDAVPTLRELERLVDARSESEPARAESWRWSLSHLREFADADGRLPEDFRPTIEIVFRDLLSDRA